MARTALMVITLVLALAAGGGGHLVWGDSAPGADDSIIWGN